MPTSSTVRKNNINPNYFRKLGWWGAAAEAWARLTPPCESKPQPLRQRRARRPRSLHKLELRSREGEREAEAANQRPGRASSAPHRPPMRRRWGSANAERRGAVPEFGVSRWRAPSDAVRSLSTAARAALEAGSRRPGPRTLELSSLLAACQRPVARSCAPAPRPPVGVASLTWAFKGRLQGLEDQARTAVGRALYVCNAL